MAVDLAGVLPLRFEPLLRLGADDPGDDRRERKRDEGEQRELPGHDEHHHADADDRQRRLDELGERLLQGLLDVVDVVRHPRHHVTALPRVEIPQRQTVDLAFDVLTQSVDHAHDEGVEDVALRPHEHRGDEVHEEDDDDDLAERGEVDALSRHHSGGGEHVRVVVAALRTCAGDDVLDVRSGGQLSADDAGVDDVHRLAEHLGGDDGEDDRADDKEDDPDQAGLLTGHEPEEPFDRGPEVLGLAGRGAPEHVSVVAVGNVVVLGFGGHGRTARRGGFGVVRVLLRHVSSPLPR
ncbi:Uncharacterised protein [Mycobacteroides abscessus subsp. abscessus]|nr:Uncharacterised protein [Mycobacteroides abscessus subsp. abscessus]